MNSTPDIQPPQEDPFSIDYKRVIYQALRSWYWIVLSVVLCLVASFIINRYSARIYAVNASILIKESGDAASIKPIYSSPVLQVSRNYLNEIYILKSIPLIQRTVKQLGFEHSFFRVGNILTTESYKELPLQVVFLDSITYSMSFEFEFTENNKIAVFDPTDGAQVAEFIVGDTISIFGKKMMFKVFGKVPEDLRSFHWVYSFIPAQSVARQYVNLLTAGWAEEGAGIIDLSISSPSPSKARDFIDGLIRNYQNYDLERKNAASSNSILFINEQLASITDSLNQAERQLELFKTKNVITDLNGEALRLYHQIEALELQKTELLIGEKYYYYLEEYLNRGKDLDKVILPISIGIKDEVLRMLVQKMVEEQASFNSKLTNVKVETPLLLQKRTEIEELKKAILESVKNQKEVNKIQYSFLNDRLKELEALVSRLPIAERQLVNIKRNYSLLESLYVYLLQRRAEAGITKASNTTDIVEVNPPLINGPIAPNTTRNNIIWLSIGLIFPFLIIIAIEIFNTRVQSREDIEKATSIPFLGGVGHKNTSKNLEVFDRPKSAISESFRALRSNLSYFLNKKEQGVFLVSSSISGEGKTFTSINLAAVFALSGKKTLIVGADMRKPRIFSDLNLTNDYGLSNYLAGLMTFDEVVQKTTYDNLVLVSGGPVPPNPSELLLSNRMKTFVEEARSKYDYIFIDSPPLALVTDAFVLSALVDHTLFIIRQNVTPKSLIRTIDDYYRAGKISQMSIVLNDIYKSGPGYGYGYGYAYGYGYGIYGYGSKKKKNGHGYYEES